MKTKLNKLLWFKEFTIVSSGQFAEKDQVWFPPLKLFEERLPYVWFLYNIHWVALELGRKCIKQLHPVVINSWANFKLQNTLSGFILFPIYLLVYKSMNTWSFSTCPMSNHPFQTKALVTQTIFISRLFGFVQNLLNQRESSQQYRKSAPIKVDRYENIACKVLYMTLHSATSKCENGKASSTCSMWCLICCTSAKTLSTKQPVRTYRGGQIWK